MNTNEWQPIETAPKDGTLILGYLPSYDDVNVIYYLYNYEFPQWFNPCDDAVCSPTHWMPLPKPPTQ